MSLQIIKPGLLDTIQDTGRYGYQHLGINPSGAMDRFAAQLANALLGKELNSPVIEMHFPAAQILFEKETIMCITGADFCPVVNKNKIPMNRPVSVNKNTELRFEKKINGARCYVSILHEFKIESWLNSYSTNLVAGAGGFKGRALKKGDVLHFKDRNGMNHMQGKEIDILPWKATESISLKKEIRFVKGNEWDLLTADAINILTGEKFEITSNSNRMGYRLKGTDLRVKENKQLVSSGVTFGTTQLLPGGQLIILMADHQTTGGYPRIGHVISADLPLLAQSNPGEQIRFSAVDLTVATQALIDQHRNLQQVQSASLFKIEKLLNGTRRSEL